jgi:hypothetical protein
MLEEGGERSLVKGRPLGGFRQFSLVSGAKPTSPALLAINIPQAGLGTFSLCQYSPPIMGQGQSNEEGPHLTTAQVSHELVRCRPLPKPRR